MALASGPARNATALAISSGSHQAAQCGIALEAADIALAAVDRGLQRRGAGIAGRDRIDPDPGRAPFGGQARRHRDDRCLGRRIGMQRHRAHAGDRGDVDDRAAARGRSSPGERDAGDIGARAGRRARRRPTTPWPGRSGRSGRLDDAGAVDQDLDRRRARPRRVRRRRCRAASSVTSPANAVAPAISRATACACARSRSTTATVAPRLASSMAAGGADAAGAAGDDRHSGRLPSFRHCALLLKPGRRAPAGCATSRR